MQECSVILNGIAKAQFAFNSSLRDRTSEFRSLKQSKEGITTSQVRRVMVAISKDMDVLSSSLESDSIALKDHFAKAMDNAIALQKSAIGGMSGKKENRRSCQKMVEEINEVKASIVKVKDSINAVPDLDKTYRKSKNRLLRAYDGLQDMMVACIRNANEIQVV